MRQRILCASAAVLLLSGTFDRPARAGITYSFTTFSDPNASGATSSSDAGTHALGINDQGQIVGDYISGGTYHAFELSGGVFTTIDLPGSTYSRAWAINDAGEIVGDTVVNGMTHGFVLSSSGYTLLNYPGAVGTEALGIDGNGDIVGTYSDGTKYHGFELVGGQYTSFDFPGATATGIYDINNSGQMVGTYFTASATYGFRYDNGTFTQLNVANNWRATGINDNGDIVGGSGYVIYSDGTSESLSDPALFGSLLPLKINDAGEIVGHYADANGVYHSFLAVPTPEPSTLVLFGFAFVGLAVVKGGSRLRNAMAKG